MRFHFVHSVFMGNKGDAEKMKVLITEERYRHEAKFAEPESNPSNHNFAIAVSARGGVGVASPLAFVHLTKYQSSSGSQCMGCGIAIHICAWKVSIAL